MWAAALLHRSHRLFQQLFNSDIQNTGNRFQLNIRHKPLAALNPLHGVFVHIQAPQLEQIGKSSLRQLRRSGFAQCVHSSAADIITPIRCVIFIHKTTLLTFIDCHMSDFMVSRSHN